MKNILMFIMLAIIVSSCSKETTEIQDSDDFSGINGKFIDERDGREYKWVKIGEQIWMAENLAYQFDKPGHTGNPYDFHEEYLDVYGGLYDWVDAHLACPKGWHVPTEAEWNELADFVSNQNGGYAKIMNGVENGLGYEEGWEYVGTHLKAKSGWPNNANGTDDYGFGALPGGIRSFYGVYNSLGTRGNWWASSNSTYSSTGLVCIFISSEVDGVLYTKSNDMLKKESVPNSLLYIDYRSGDYRLSVRCIKD